MPPLHFSIQRFFKMLRVSGYSVMRFIFLCVAIFAPVWGIAQPSTKPAPSSAGAAPFVLGSIETIQSAVLGESRTLNIYLPEGYSRTDTTRYPVIYLLDGSADEDFIHVAGLVQFCSFEWVNLLPQSILIGIATVDRRRDYTFPSTIDDDRKLAPTSGKSAAFMTFIERELQPFVDKKFRSSSQRTLIGQSMGGLFATEVLLKMPALFTHFIIVSPSLWWDDGSLLRYESVALKAHAKPLSVMISVGKEGLGPSKTPHVMEVDAHVLADRLKALKNGQLQVHFDYLPEENHATILHPALHRAFRTLWGGR
jgi:predicted alpha/beta superfamily hydrolase